MPDEGFRHSHCRRGHLYSEVGHATNGGCRLCASNTQRAWRKENPEKYKALCVGRKRNKEQARLYTHTHRLKHIYGMSAEDLSLLVLKQENTCAICHDTFDSTPNIDHIHGTKIVRGLLCRGCNVGLGMFKENPQTLEAAIKYLKETQKCPSI